MARKDPRHVSQFDGSPYARYNCTAAVGAMELDAATNGASTTTGGRIRELQGDKTGGIGLDDVAVALKAGWGITYSHGRRSWAAVRARLVAQDGVGMQGLYAAVPVGYRAQKNFIAGHAVYASRITSPGRVLVHDPIARVATEWPESVVRNFYLSGLATAGWSIGEASSTPVGILASTSGWLDAWAGLVSYPVGHILTADDVADIERKLYAAGWFGDPALGLFNAQIAHGILMRHVGQAWNKALQDQIAGEFGAAAGEAGAFGRDVGAIVEQAGAVAGQVLTNAVFLIAILGLVLLGLWLLVRSDR